MVNGLQFPEVVGPTLEHRTSSFSEHSREYMLDRLLYRIQENRDYLLVRFLCSLLLSLGDSARI